MSSDSVSEVIAPDGRSALVRDIPLAGPAARAA